jgi:hypothetical protein
MNTKIKRSVMAITIAGSLFNYAEAGVVDADVFGFITTGDEIGFMRQFSDFLCLPTQTATMLTPVVLSLNGITIVNANGIRIASIQKSEKGTGTDSSAQHMEIYAQDDSSKKVTHLSGTFFLTELGIELDFKEIRDCGVIHREDTIKMYMNKGYSRPEAEELANLFLEVVRNRVGFFNVAQKNFGIGKDGCVCDIDYKDLIPEWIDQ